MKFFVKCNAMKLNVVLIGPNEKKLTMMYESLNHNHLPEQLIIVKYVYVHVFNVNSSVHLINLTWLIL